MPHTRSLADPYDSKSEITSIPSSDAKKGFANLIRRVVRTNEPVLITRNSHPTAVLLSLDEYKRLIESIPDPLANLRDQFDQQLAAMQTAKAKAGVDALFASTPRQLGKAALKAADKGQR